MQRALLFATTKVLRLTVMAWFSALFALALSASAAVFYALVLRHRRRATLPAPEPVITPVPEYSAVHRLGEPHSHGVAQALPTREMPVAPVSRARALSVHEAPTREFAAHLDRNDELSVHSAPTREFSAHLDDAWPLLPQVPSEESRSPRAHLATEPLVGNDDLTSMDVLFGLEAEAMDKTVSATTCTARALVANDTAPLSGVAPAKAARSPGRGLPPPSPMARDKALGLLARNDAQTRVSVSETGRVRVSPHGARTSSSAIHASVKNSGYAPVNPDDAELEPEVEVEAAR
jgi:hypothetical protein